MTSTKDDLYFDEEAPLQNDDDKFHPIPINLKPEPEPEPEPDPNVPRVKTKHDPGVEILGLGPLSFPSSRSNSGSEATLSQETAGHRRVMSDAAATALVDSLHHETTQASQGGSDTASASNPDDLQKFAALAMRVGERSPQRLVSRPVHRVDSAQDSSESVPQLAPEKRPQRSGRASPLKLNTEPPSMANLPAALAEDSITKSPTLSKHMIQVEEKVTSSLPPVQGNSPTADTSATSPKKKSLPPFRQLADLADIASQQQGTPQDARAPTQHSHQHSHSFSSTTSQSPMVPYHPSYTNSAQTSPVSYHGFARSPTSTVGEGFTYGSPSQYPGSAYYADRRTSVANESSHTYPTPVPSLPSNPSSGESQVGNAGSSTDGYSTSHTTPVEAGPLPPDGMQRPILPPVPGMPAGLAGISTGGFTCDYPGCTALSFQTQYLLRYVEICDWREEIVVV